jgi:hypothetical protein
LVRLDNSSYSLVAYSWGPRPQVAIGLEVQMKDYFKRTSFAWALRNLWGGVFSEAGFSAVFIPLDVWCRCCKGPPVCDGWHRDLDFTIFNFGISIRTTTFQTVEERIKYENEVRDKLNQGE